MESQEYGEAKNIVRHLHFIGIFPDRKRIGIRTILLFILTHGYLIHVLSYTTWYAFTHKQWKSFYFNLSAIVRCTVNMISLDICLYHRKRILTCAKLIWKFHEKMDFKHKAKRSSFKNNVILFMTWVYVIYHFILNWHWIVVQFDYKIYVHYYIYDWELLKSSKWLGLTASLVDLTVFYYVTSIINYLYVYAIVTGDTLSLCVQKFGQLLRILRYDQLLKYHTELLEIIREYNKFMNVLYMVWLVDWMTSFFVDFPKVINLSSSDFAQSVFFGIQFFVNVTSSFMVSFALGKLQSDQTELLSAVHRRLGKMNNHSLKQDLHNANLARKIYYGRSIGQVIMFKTVPVNKGLIVSLYSVVASFVIFILEELRKDAN